MGNDSNSGTAVVAFASAGEAARRVAGVAAAGRIVRALAEAGYREARLVRPLGQGLPKAAAADIARLAGPMRVELASGDPTGEGPVFPGSRLPGPDPIRLDRPNAAAEILRSTGKTGDGPVSRLLNRPVSRRLSALLLRVPGIRPAHATLGTALIALLMFAALVGGGSFSLIAGAVLYQAASVFDGVDGEIARATFRSSRRGAMLDSFVDVATNLLFLVGLAWNLGRRGETEADELAGWGFALMVLGLGLVAWRALRTHSGFSLDLVKHRYRRRYSGRLLPLLIEAATVVSSRDFFALLFALLILAGFPVAVLYLFAAAASIWILFVLASVLAPADSAPAPSASP